MESRTPPSVTQQSEDAADDFGFMITLYPPNQKVRRRQNAVFYKLYSLAKQGKEQEIRDLNKNKSDFILTYHSVKNSIIPNINEENHPLGGDNPNNYPSFVTEADMAEADKLEDGMDYPAAVYRLAKEGENKAAVLLTRICNTNSHTQLFVGGICAGGRIDWLLRNVQGMSNENLAEFIVKSGALHSEESAARTFATAPKEVADIVKDLAAKSLQCKDQMEASPKFAGSESDSESESEDEEDVEFNNKIFPGFEEKYLLSPASSSSLSVQGVSSTLFHTHLKTANSATQTKDDAARPKSP